jgi:hypothetical protein
MPGLRWSGEVCTRVRSSAKGGYSLFGRNCGSFQENMMKSCCLQKPTRFVPSMPQIYVAPLL